MTMEGGGHRLDQEINVEDDIIEESISPSQNVLRSYNPFLRYAN